MAARIRKGDKVVMTTGRDRGKSGEVLKVLKDDDRVIIQGVNMVKRHMRPTQFDAGGIREKEGPVHVSNVAHVDPKTGEATRVGFKVLDDGRKVRVSKKSGEVIDV